MKNSCHFNRFCKFFSPWGGGLQQHINKRIQLRDACSLGHVCSFAVIHYHSENHPGNADRAVTREAVVITSNRSQSNANCSLKESLLPLLLGL